MCFGFNCLAESVCDRKCCTGLLQKEQIELLSWRANSCGILTRPALGVDKISSSQEGSFTGKRNRVFDAWD